MARAFRYSADYLPSTGQSPTTWAPSDRKVPGGPGALRSGQHLKAYGRQGHRKIVEHCLDIAQHFAEQVHRMRPGTDGRRKLNIVAFRFNPGGLSEAATGRAESATGRDRHRRWPVYGRHLEDWTTHDFQTGIFKLAHT